MLAYLASQCNLQSKCVHVWKKCTLNQELYLFNHDLTAVFDCTERLLQEELCQAAVIEDVMAYQEVTCCSASHS